MRGHAQVRDRRDVRIGTRIEAVGEQARDAVAAEDARRHGDAVDDDQRDLGCGRSRVAVGRTDLPREIRVTAFVDRKTPRSRRCRHGPAPPAPAI